MSGLPDKYDLAQCERFLREMGESGATVLPIADAALALASFDRPRVGLARYSRHLRALAQDVARRAGAAAGLEAQANALNEIILLKHGYSGDELTYDDLQNANLMRVIDRRRGLPVALGILYLHAARAAGMEAAGLNTQSHFVLCLALGGEDMIIDPFNGGAAVNQAHVPVELRADDAGLAELVSDTDVLLRLQNNLKLRALNAGDHARGLELSRRMVLIAPRRSDLWFDLARLNEALGVLGAARRAYETCLALAPPGETLHNEAAISLSQLKRRLN